MRSASCPRTPPAAVRPKPKTTAPSRSSIRRYSTPTPRATAGSPTVPPSRPSGRAEGRSRDHGAVSLPPDVAAGRSAYVLHPVLLDAAFHLFGPVLPDKYSTYLPIAPSPSNTWPIRGHKAPRVWRYTRTRGERARCGPTSSSATPPVRWRSGSRACTCSARRRRRCGARWRETSPGCSTSSSGRTTPAGASGRGPPPPLADLRRRGGRGRRAGGGVGARARHLHGGDRAGERAVRRARFGGGRHRLPVGARHAAPHRACGVRRPARLRAAPRSRQGAGRELEARPAHAGHARRGFHGPAPDGLEPAAGRSRRPAADDPGRGARPALPACRPRSHARAAHARRRGGAARAEALQPDRESHVALRAHQRLALRLERLRAPAAEAGPVQVWLREYGSADDLVLVPAERRDPGPARWRSPCARLA